MQSMRRFSRLGDLVFGERGIYGEAFGDAACKSFAPYVRIVWRWFVGGE